MGQRAVVAGVLGALLVLGGCGGGGEGERAALGSVGAAVPAASPVVAGTEVVAVVAVADGDTFTATGGRTVRILGIDSCELGTVAGRDALGYAKRLLRVGDAVTLRTEPGVDRDPYGRQLRYVATVGGSDVGSAMVRHPHTGVYEGGDARPGYVADLRRLDDGPRICDATTTAATPIPTTTAIPTTTPIPTTTAAPAVRATTRPAPQPAPQPIAQPAPRPAPQPDPEPRGGGCHPSYTPCVPDGPDLDCPDIGFMVIVTGPDEFRLDGSDNDGKGCESYG